MIHLPDIVRGLPALLLVLLSTPGLAQPVAETPGNPSVPAAAPALATDAPMTWSQRARTWNTEVRRLYQRKSRQMQELWQMSPRLPARPRGQQNRDAIMAHYNKMRDSFTRYQQRIMTELQRKQEKWSEFYQRQRGLAKEYREEMLQQAQRPMQDIVKDWKEKQQAVMARHQALMRKPETP